MQQEIKHDLRDVKKDTAHCCQYCDMELYPEWCFKVIFRDFTAGVDQTVVFCWVFAPCGGWMFRHFGGLLGTLNHYTKQNPKKAHQLMLQADSTTPTLNLQYYTMNNSNYCGLYNKVFLKQNIHFFILRFMPIYLRCRNLFVCDFNDVRNCLELHLNTPRRQDINILIHLIKYNTHITVVHT
jgi:hypothetical protein